MAVFELNVLYIPITYQIISTKPALCKTIFEKIGIVPKFVDEILSGKKRLSR